jgi:hypothetical protein
MPGNWWENDAPVSEGDQRQRRDEPVVPSQWGRPPPRSRRRVPLWLWIVAGTVLVALAATGGVILAGSNSSSSRVSSSSQIQGPTPTGGSDWLAQAQADCQTAINTIRSGGGVFAPATKASVNTVKDAENYLNAVASAFQHTFIIQLQALFNDSNSNLLGPVTTDIDAQVMVSFKVEDALTSHQVDPSTPYSSIGGSYPDIGTLITQLNAAADTTNAAFTAAGLSNCTQTP